MSLWIVGVGMLFGILSGLVTNRHRLSSEHLHMEIRRIAGKKRRKNFRPVYLSLPRDRSILRSAVVVLTVGLAVCACWFFVAGDLSFFRQLLTGVWMWYLVRRLTTLLSRKDLIRRPVILISGCGLWIREPEGGQFRRTAWEDVETITVARGKNDRSERAAKKILPLQPSRVTVRLKDGTMFAADGVRGNARTLADRVGEWLPARDVKIN